MPLEESKAGSPGFENNIKTEIAAGKPVKQAVAIAYSKAGEGRKDAVAGWDESAHERGKDGKFGGGGSPTSGSSPDAKKAASAGRKDFAQGRAPKPNSSPEYVKAYEASKKEYDEGRKAFERGEAYPFSANGAFRGGYNAAQDVKNGKRASSEPHSKPWRGSGRSDAGPDRKDAVECLQDAADQFFAKADGASANREQYDKEQAAAYQANAAKARAEHADWAKQHPNASEGEKTKKYRELEKKHDADRFKSYPAGRKAAESRDRGRSDAAGKTEVVKIDGKSFTIKEVGPKSWRYEAGLVSRNGSGLDSESARQNLIARLKEDFAGSRSDAAFTLPSNWEGQPASFYRGKIEGLKAEKASLLRYKKREMEAGGRAGASAGSSYDPDIKRIDMMIQYCEGKGRSRSDADGPKYNEEAVNKAIANNRTGKIGKREGKMIHALLKGSQGYASRKDAARSIADEPPEAEAEGRLTEKERSGIGKPGDDRREDMPESAFLEPASRKYPVKEKKGDSWEYDRELLLAAARRARLEGNKPLAEKADSIREMKFGGGAPI